MLIQFSMINVMCGRIKETYSAFINSWLGDLVYNYGVYQVYMYGIFWLECCLQVGAQLDMRGRCISKEETAH